MTRKNQKSGESRPTELDDDALNSTSGGAAHELAHVVQQGRTVQYNPKELSVDKSVPWK